MCERWRDAHETFLECVADPCMAAHGCDCPAEAQPKEVLAEVERSLVPEEGIEPTRVDSTGF